MKRNDIHATAAKRCPHRKIGGMPVALCGEAELTDLMRADIAASKQQRLPSPVTVFSANGHSLSLYASSPDFADAMDAASLIHADGQSVVTMSRLLPGPRIKGRSATTDFIHAAAKAAAASDASFFLLGARQEVNRRAVDTLRRTYPDLAIAGARHGYFAQDEEQQIIDQINASGADVLWVGLGKPREQMFIHRNRHKLRCAWIVSCGGCFDFLTGDYRRAPRWMQVAGLEWLHRAATGPRYLMLRYLTTNLHTIWLGIRYARIT